MKNRLKLASHLLYGSAFVWMLGSCTLDYTNTEGINPDNVWNDGQMIIAYLSDIHGGMMPGWPMGSGNDSDESMNGVGYMGDWARGIIGVETSASGFDYGNIDKINFLLEKLEITPVTVLSETENKQVKGQTLFWRAWDYFGKIRTFGGVPLILKFQNVNDYESLFVARNTAAECMTQIIKDLDDAIACLPDRWDDANYGRIDKGTAMAFKGRVLLWYASPLFNPTNDAKRWQAAYDANQAAVTFLRGIGKGLHPDFSEIWNKEQNEEVIMVNQFFYPDHAAEQNRERPEPLSKDYSNYDQPIGQLLLAFPQKDGSPLVLDKERLKDPVYNADFLNRFYNNRDDRFGTSIFCGGTKYPSVDPILAGQNYWCTWMSAEDGSHISMINKQLSINVGEDVGGFFRKKGIDASLSKTTVYEGETDWVEIRFAEVLMNYGECANEVGKSDEALDVLYQIRKRAGIEAGETNHYGITAVSEEEIRQACVNERFVEFAFEGKRGGDLKRWKRWSDLNEMKHHWGIHIVVNNNVDVESFDWSSDITHPEVMKKFHVQYIENLDGKDIYTFNYDLEHWFSPIKKEDMDRNSKLKQNKEWGGTFDPLQ